MNCLTTRELSAYLQTQTDQRQTPAAGVLRGVIIATEGWFTEPNPRGQFTLKSLQSIVAEMRKNDMHEGGTKVMLGHEHREGMLIGRARAPRLSTATRDDYEDPVRAVRANLHFAPAARISPYGDLQEYVTSVAETDVRGLMMSLVIMPLMFAVPDGPPVWIATQIDGVDLVSNGAATTALLQRERFPRYELARMAMTVAVLS